MSALMESMIRDDKTSPDLEDYRLIHEILDSRRRIASLETKIINLHADLQSERQRLAELEASVIEQDAPPAQQVAIITTISDPIA